MKTLYSLLFSILFSLTSVSSIGQAEQISDIHVGYFTDVLYTDGNQLLVKSNNASLNIYDLESEEVTQSFSGYLLEEFKLNGDQFFLLQDTVLSTLQITEDEILHNELPGEYAGNVFLPDGEMPADRMGISTPSGLLITNGSDFFHEVELDTSSMGWSSIGENLLTYTNQNYYLLDANYSIIDSGALPEGLVVFEDAAYSDQIIVAEEIEEEAAFNLFSFNISDSSIEPIINADGSLLQISDVNRYFSQKRRGSQLVFAWSEYWENPYQRSYPHRIATVNISSGSGYVHPLDNRIIQGSMPYYLSETNSGIVAFGRFSNTGIEPYVASSDTLQVLKDIYKGYGPSLEIQRVNGDYPNETNEFSFTSKNNNIFFIANHPKLGRELWRTDGTSEGTVPICDLEPGPKGLDKVHVITGHESDPYVYLMAWGEAEYLGVFKMPASAEPLVIEDTPNQWEATFALNSDANNLSAPGLSGPELYPAKDASVAFLNVRVTLDTDWISLNSFKYANYYDSTWTRGGVINVVEDDGTTRFAKGISFESYNDIPVVGRDYETGEILLSIPHRYGFSRYGNKTYHQWEDGTLLIMLNPDGTIKWDKFFPSETVVRRIEVSEEEIILFGDFLGSFTLGGSTITSGSTLTGFIAKLSNTGEPVWLKSISKSRKYSDGGKYRMAVDRPSSKIYTYFPEDEISTVFAFSRLITCWELETGEMMWTKRMRTNSFLEVNDLSLAKNGELWISGFARGDFSIYDKLFELQENYEGSDSKNSFQIILNPLGEILSLRADEPHKQKILQDVGMTDDGVYILSLVREEDPFMYEVHGRLASYSVQLDLRSFSGRLLDSFRWPTGIHGAAEFNDQRMGLALHPEEGIFISGRNMYSGLVDNFSSIPSQLIISPYFLLQRRSAPEIDLSFADEVLEANDEQFLFPNPVNTRQYVNLLLRENDLERFENLIFYDNTGRQVFSYQLADDLLEQRVRIPNDLSDGLYVVRLEGKELKTMKLIVRRW